MATIWLQIWAHLSASSLFWLSFTLVVYLIAASLYQRNNGNPLLLPVITAVMCIIGFLYATETPYDLYAERTWFLQFLIGPATVALAVPLYGQLSRLKRLFWPILVALVAGSATAILSAVAISRLLGASLQTQLSLAPKSATMPIAMEIAGLTGGLPSLTTVAVAITGIAAALIAGPLFKMLDVENPEVEGFALGLAGHAIGTARAFQANDTAGAFAALGMGLNGIATAVLIPLLLAVLALV
ncbi:LrgB family protein [Candidimonas sp. SYP-B2681]|uniref:LrgB family protein n=1 Tax=Candidimonas sp. SYP-B2681 TaxID=2497686 RepID=UPI000F889A95|nr:LrgB family protein [Candidimonas sp. SYP-B2681]RTZ47857.1 LrgB family protein [Candidimonas sp. SYP-B2681]